MAKLKDGFYKQTNTSIGSDSHVLLAGGGSKALSDFATASGVVTALGTNGNYLTWTKNGSVNSITIPYATSAYNADTVDGQNFIYTNSSDSPTYLWGTNSNGTSFLAARGSISVNYASSAGNADTVDGQNFSYSNESNSPTYLWGTNSNGTSFLASRGSISVNYASSAGNADNADTVDNKHASDFAASNCGVWPTRSFTKSLAPTTSWQDTGITTNDLSDGEGAYLIFLNPNHSNYNDGWMPKYAGLFSNMSGTNGNETEEIILQASSHASYKRLFLRFINTPNTLGYRKLQIRAASNYTSSYNMIFNIRRIV